MLSVFSISLVIELTCMSYRCEHIDHVEAVAEQNAVEFVGPSEPFPAVASVCDLQHTGHEVCRVGDGLLRSFSPVSLLAEPLDQQVYLTFHKPHLKWCSSALVDILHSSND